MINFIIAFIASFITILVILRFNKFHKNYSADWDFSGPQKTHKNPVPRIGGIAIFTGFVLAALFEIVKLENGNIYSAIIISMIPVFAIGLTEDITKKISVLLRLFFTVLSATLIYYLAHIGIIRTDLPIIDYLLTVPAFSLIFTIFAITGLANAYNIIDGFNGLASMVGMMSLLGIGYVSHCLNDTLVVKLSIIMLCSIFGFFLWNYPLGLIFLGDGGAYLIGFWVAFLSLFLISRHPEISPWFGILINGYPISETLFSIYRRIIHQNKRLYHPDGLHLHSLIYRRRLKGSNQMNVVSNKFANPRTSPFLWALSGGAIIPAILFWNSTIKLIIFLLIFVLTYLWAYRSIVTFKRFVKLNETPRSQ